MSLPKVEIALDGDGVLPWRPHDRMRLVLRVRAAEIEQFAVAASHGNDAQIGDGRGAAARCVGGMVVMQDLSGELSVVVT